jgi:hypothetical protein
MPGFINLIDFLNANKGKGDQMARKAIQKLSPQLSAASGAISNIASGGYSPNAQSAVDQAQADLSLMGSTAGLAGLTEEDGKLKSDPNNPMTGLYGGRNTAEGLMDAFLMGQSQTMAKAKRNFGGLRDKLAAAQVQGARQRGQMDIQGGRQFNDVQRQALGQAVLGGKQGYLEPQTEDDNQTKPGVWTPFGLRAGNL